MSSKPDDRWDVIGLFDFVIKPISAELCPWNMTWCNWLVSWICDLDTAHDIFGLKTCLASIDEFREFALEKKHTCANYCLQTRLLPNQVERASAPHLLRICDNKTLNYVFQTLAKRIISWLVIHHAANLYWIWASDRTLRHLIRHECQIRSIWAE